MHSSICRTRINVRKYSGENSTELSTLNLKEESSCTRLSYSFTPSSPSIMPVLRAHTFTLVIYSRHRTNGPVTKTKEMEWKTRAIINDVPTSCMSPNRSRPSEARSTPSRSPFAGSERTCRARTRPSNVRAKTAHSPAAARRTGRARSTARRGMGYTLRHRNSCIGTLTVSVVIAEFERRRLRTRVTSLSLLFI